MLENNYYQILGVSFNANEEELKVAYRELAKQFHPDVNPSKDTLAHFQLISLAYDVLSDPIKRKKYDLILKYGAELKPVTQEKPKHRDPKYRPKSGTFSAFDNLRRKKVKKMDKKTMLVIRLLFGSMACIGLVVLTFAIIDIQSDGREAYERGVGGFVFSAVFLGLLLLGWVNKIYEQ